MQRIRLEKRNWKYPDGSECKNSRSNPLRSIKMFEAVEIDEGQMFERCFPQLPRIPKFDPGKKRAVACKGQSLHNFCRSLFGKYPKVSRIDCNLCGKSIGVQNNKSLRSDCIIGHACIHAGVKPIKCRHCENPFRERGPVCYHLVRAHGIKPTSNDFEDLSEKFRDVISNSIKRCFTECKEGAASKEVKDKTRDEIHVRSRMTNGSELALQRQIFFNCTIKTNANADGKVKCRLCSMEIKATRNVGPNIRGNYRSLWAVRHAQCHLSKPLYRCGTCNESRNTYPAMEQHLKRKHALKMNQNHECFDDKFHSDILAIFAKCYGSTA